MKEALNIIILAAGKGTRMRSSKPKVLHEIGGKPILQHVIDEAKQLHPDKIVIVYGHGGNEVKSTLNQENLIWVEQVEQLGTGHAVIQAIPVLDANSQVLILLGDVPLLKSELCQSLLTQSHDCLGILSCKKQNPTGYGRIVRDQANVKAIVEQKDASNEELAIKEVNTGVMAMPSNKLITWLKQINNHNAQKEYYLTDIVKLAVDEGTQVIATVTEDEMSVEGINSKVDLAKVERAYQTTQALGLMQEGVTLADPAQIEVRGQIQAGRDVSIDVGCIFEGSVEIGDNVTIGPYCVIKDCKIEENSQIEAYSHLDNSTIGRNCRVGPYARLRPGASLQSNNHIGNFVEIKNAKVGDGSKVNHLSYIGDAVVGSAVNVGAGAITCNYDGANKFKTIIEDNVFIGSDSQLIAPVTIKQGSTIGAGSTITKNTEENSLTICRSKEQVTISNWQRPVKQKKDN